MKKLLVSFSGGETSAYMAQWLWRHKREEYEMIFVFANTGQENEETLRFVHQCEKYFDFPVVWIEAVPRVKVLGKILDMCLSVFSLKWDDTKVGTTFKVVDFKTASREGEPFEKVIQKYGIPNKAMPHCTRELKQHPIEAYAKSIGWKDCYMAIGIREDEFDRMSSKRKEKRLIYPLISMQPMTKPKINFWWSQQHFRLQLKGYQGNCKTCWKKSDHKLFTIAKENEQAFLFMGKMEARYGKYIPETRLKLMQERGELPTYPITFFRRNRSAIDIINESKKYVKKIIDDSQIFHSQKSLFDEDTDLMGGESCEVFSECESTL